MQRELSIKTAQKLIAQLELARIQLNKAEGGVFAAKERAGLAKRKRKEAKEAHRRAKKDVKRAKGELCEARVAMSKAEAGLARAGTVRTWEEKHTPVKPSPRKAGKLASMAAAHKNQNPLEKPVLVPVSPIGLETVEPRQESGAGSPGQ